MGKHFGSTKGKLGTGAIIAIIAVAAVVLGVVNIQGVSFSSMGGQQQAAPQVGTVTTASCQTDGTNTLDLVVRNDLATTASLYTRGTIAAFGGNGDLIASGTSDGSSTMTYTSLNIPCSADKLSGKAAVLASTAAPGTLVNSKVVTYAFGAGETAIQKIIGSSNSTSLQFTIRNTALTNTSETTQTANSANETGATTMGASATRSGYIDIEGVTAAAQFGSDNGGILWVVDTSDSAVFSDNAISLSSSNIQLTGVACPARALSFDSGNRCYKSPAIKTSDGLVRVSWSMTSDLGNPGTSADPRVYLEDLQSFEEDSKLVEDIYNKGGNNLGVSRQTVGFDNS